MTLFGNQQTEGVQESQDRLGGFRVIDTDAYLVKIKAAYAGQSSSSKAMSVTLIVESEATGEYSETVWVTSGEGKNTYVDKNDSTKLHYLPGWTTIDDVCLVTTNMGLKDMPSEEKMMDIYNSDTKQREPTKVQMFTQLIGKELYLGIVKETRNKQKKTDNGYVDTAETRDENSIEKVFHYPSKLTIVEARNKIQTATFYVNWVERNRGQTRDRTNKNVTEANGRPGRPGGNQPPKAGESAPKTNSLF